MLLPRIRNSFFNRFFLFFFLGNTLFFFIFIFFNFKAQEQSQKKHITQLYFEKINLILNERENERLLNHFENIAQAMYKLNHVHGIILWDKNCRIIRKIPLNLTPQNKDCPSINNRKSYITLSFDDPYSTLKKITFLPSTHFLQANFNLARKTFILFILCFFTLLLFFQLYASNFFNKKFRIITRDILDINSKKPCLQKSKPSVPWEMQLISLAIKDKERMLYEANKKLEQSVAAKEQVKINRQVAHDIHSPLIVLQTIIDGLDPEKEEHQVLKMVGSRIQDICYKLNPTKSPVKKSVFLVQNILDEIVSEKRVEYRQKGNITMSLEIKDDLFSFTFFEESIFKRIISNLLNNAVQAQLHDHLHIKISLTSQQEKVFITIEDNGKGIPPHILKKLGTEGFSYEKEEGKGLGLSHAISSLQKEAGELTITSQERQGTQVKLTFKSAAPPSWFFSSLNLSQWKNLVFIDDELEIHSFWKRKLQDCPQKIFHYISPQEFQTSSFLEKKHTFFFVDYYFSQEKMNGIDLIKKHGLENQSVLVTGHAQKEDIKKLCEVSHIKMFPKNLIKKFSFFS